jgi:two-component system nitrogen regulation response regulator GlnG
MADITPGKKTKPATVSLMNFSMPMLTGLTIAYHPDTSRVGEVMPLMEFLSGQRCELNRETDGFRKPGETASRALGTDFISRKSVVFEAPKNGGMQISCEEGVPAKIEGKELSGKISCIHADLQKGIVIVLGNAIVLLFHFLDKSILQSNALPCLGFIGNSTAMNKTRRSILYAADASNPVLIRGETGVGKELAAIAIHEQSARKKKNLITINIAGIPVGLAASELFGQKKGAFPDAKEDKRGAFSLADGSTLFMDEIGDISHDIQMLILRAVEYGEIQVVGGSPQKVNVRLIAATDSDLEQLMEEGRFKRPLFERLQETIVTILPLRERREDIGVLFFHFFRTALASNQELDKLDKQLEAENLWFPTELMEKLINYSWPGNIRELRNFASQIAAVNRGETHFVMSEALWRKLIGSDSTPAPNTILQAPKSEIPRRSVVDISDAEILNALKQNSFNITNAADTLGVTPQRLHDRINESPDLPKAGRLTLEQVVACRTLFNGDIEQMAAHLQVSSKGLKLRMKQLGI